jgi:hypothetical protein
MFSLAIFEALTLLTLSGLKEALLLEQISGTAQR